MIYFIYNKLHLHYPKHNLINYLSAGAPPVLQAAQVHGTARELQLRRGAGSAARLLARGHRRRRHQRGQRHFDSR